MFGEEPVRDNDGQMEEAKDVIMVLKKKKINFVEFKCLMFDKCVSIQFFSIH